MIAAGVTDAESAEFFSDPSKRDRSTTPMHVVPAGTASILLIVRPLAKDASGAPNACVTEFSTDVGAVELYQGCYVRLDALQHPTVQQIRWEFDPIAGHKPPQDAWLRPWAKLVECNPAHAPSHWHINSPATDGSRQRHRRQPIPLPELRLATGLPNPLLLLLSLSNWLRLGYQLSPD